ncbi:MAG: MBL fold metallo-hydrolase [Chloroflexi bacterium]|nr:MBL fold metallo-hydrolase [Chloroflexota bacterium]
MTRAQAGAVAVHLLDVGVEEYGDALLLRFDDHAVLVDGGHASARAANGGHTSIPDQLGQLLAQPPPYHVDLLIVTHAHADHIGCLPALVDQDLLRADWALVADPGLGWGRALNEPAPDASAPPAARQLVAALREEPLGAGTSDAVVAQFLATVGDLETTYQRMLTTLASRGTHVVRHGRDALDALTSAFAPLGLRIVGPSSDQLLVLAEQLNRAARTATQTASFAVAQDADVDLVSTYRRLVSGGLDIFAQQRQGNLINLQSIVTTFSYAGKKLLLAGDMQFANPQTTDPSILAGIAALRRDLAAHGPYSFVKFSHHGSDNAVSSDVLAELGATHYFGICAGERSSVHPNPAVLDLLQREQASITWLRTDHNRLSSYVFGPDPSKPAEISVAQGSANDATPNVRRVADLPASTDATAPAFVTADGIEVVTRIPNQATRVTVSIEVLPGQPPAAPAAAALSAQAGPVPSVTQATPAVVPAAPAQAPAATQATGASVAALAPGGGRSLPPLLFLTSADALAANIGRAEAREALDSLRAAGQLVCDTLPTGLTDSAPAIAVARAQLSQHHELQGVVLLGGLDVVPAQRLDCLPPELRQSLPPNADPDDFVVWSDDAYADVDGDGLPELPVSRIPDGSSAALVHTALQAGVAANGHSRRGVRNVARPFADATYATLPGEQPMLISAPHVYSDVPIATLDGDRVYLMLHGDFADSSRFWGEGTPNNAEAVNISSIGNPRGSTVFSGCCWGALAVDTPAGRLGLGQSPSKKVPGASMALSFLLGGARAFVGCTGAHYSPAIPPYAYFGGAMHAAFWQQLQSGLAPAAALFQAKIAYTRQMPHGQTGALAQAIEFKVLREYTCLGLGW